MESHYVGVSILVTCLFFTLSAGFVPDGRKCKSDDPRKVFPHCMYDREEKALWCDQSNYTTFPTVKNMRFIVHRHEIQKQVRAIFVNDSCLTHLHYGDLKHYEEIDTFNGRRNRIRHVQRSVFSNNRKISALDLGENLIYRIDPFVLQDLTLLKKLHLDYNKLNNAGFFQCNSVLSVETISLDHNRIDKVQKRHLNCLGNVAALRLRYNRITQIEDGAFENMVNLRKLNFDGNRLQRLSSNTFTGLTKLEELTLSDNKISTWHSEQANCLPGVTTLDLGQNHLSYFASEHIEPMSRLQYLSLAKNRISNLPEDLFMLNANITFFNVSGNILEDIPEGTFKPLRNLESLVLSNNSLLTLHVEWFLAMTRNCSATVLDVSGNMWDCDHETDVYQKLIQDEKRQCVTDNLAQSFKSSCLGIEYASDKVNAENSPRNAKPELLTTSPQQSRFTTSGQLATTVPNNYLITAIVMLLCSKEGMQKN